MVVRGLGGWWRVGLAVGNMVVVRGLGGLWWVGLAMGFKVVVRDLGGGGGGERMAGAKGRRENGCFLFYFNYLTAKSTFNLKSNGFVTAGAPNGKFSDHRGTSRISKKNWSPVGKVLTTWAPTGKTLIIKE